MLTLCTAVFTLILFLTLVQSLCEQVAMHPAAAFRGARASGSERVRPAYDYPRGCGQRGAAAGHVGHAAPRVLRGADRSLHTHFELTSGPERQRLRLAARRQRAGGACGVAAACGGGAMARNSQRVRAARHASRLFHLHHQTLLRRERPRRLYPIISFFFYCSLVLFVGWYCFLLCRCIINILIINFYF